MAISFEKSVEDKNPNQEGWHCTVKVSENLVEYQAFNDQVETGYYEHINFRTNHVMESFESGYGAESDLIRIRNICLTDEAQNVVE
jgi:hypothetical protein